MNNYKISNDVILSHYHSWFDNCPRLKDVDDPNISIDNSYDWELCIKNNVYNLEQYIYSNDIRILKFMIMEESCFYSYDSYTLDMLIRVSKFLREKQGYVEIFWGGESCSNYIHDKLVESGVNEYFNPWLPLYVSLNIWKNKSSKDIPPIYLFNSLIKKSKYHRAVMMDFLSKNNLIDTNMVAWRKETAYFFNQLKYEWKYWKEKSIKFDEVVEDWNMQWSMPDYYYSTCLDLVTESESDLPLVTEKTWRSILHSRIFISLAFPGYYKWLEEKGFLLYNELFDYSFDTLPNVEDRAESIANQLKHIQDTYKLIEIKSMISEKIKFNREHALSLLNLLDIPEFYEEYYKKKLSWWRDVS